MEMNRFYRYLYCVLFFCLVSCGDSDEPSKLQKLTEDLQQVAKETKDALTELVPDTQGVKEGTQQEIEKLFIFEYKIVELAKDSSIQKMEEVLVDLGKDRWECFHIEPVPTGLQVFCKRRPKTPLRYIPRMFPP